jgi:DNA topoisomerase IA
VLQFVTLDLHTVAGPCQFPTLGFVVSRYEQVQSFVPEQFWYIYLTLTRPDAAEEGGETTTEFTWKRGKLFEFNVALAIYEGVLEDPIARVTQVRRKPTKHWYVLRALCTTLTHTGLFDRKPLPLTTVELQKAGSRLLHLTPKKTLDVGPLTCFKVCHTHELSYLDCRTSLSTRVHIISTYRNGSIRPSLRFSNSYREAGC